MGLFLNLKKIKAAIIFAVSNFGPLIVFFGVNYFLGLKPAIAGSLLFCIAEIVYRFYRKERTTTLFKYTAVTTFVFGAFDLYADNSFLFKYEAVVTNLLTAGVFVASLSSEKSIIQDFYEKQPNAKPMTPVKLVYFRFLTFVWISYFVLKSGIYLWLANQYSLEQGILIRVLIGSVSFYGLLFISIFGSKRLVPVMQRYKWLPQDMAKQEQ